MDIREDSTTHNRTLSKPKIDTESSDSLIYKMMVSSLVIYLIWILLDIVNTIWINM